MRFPGVRLFCFMVLCQIHTSWADEDDLLRCAYDVVTTYFQEDCISFFFEAHNASSDGMFTNLLKMVGDNTLIYLLAPVSGAPIFNSISKRLPVKPFPCSYVIALSHVGSNITWSLITGSYNQGNYFLNESRYLIVSLEEHSLQQVTQVLMDVFTYGFLDVNFINPEGTQINIYTLFPFGKTLDSCPETAPVLDHVATWEDGVLVEQAVMFPKKLPSGLFNGCNWKISCAHYQPYILTKTGGNIIGPLEGYDAGPLSLMTERLNLTPHWTIDSVNLWKKILPNGTVLGSITDLTLGRGAQMSCGGLSQRWGAIGDTTGTLFYSWASALWFVAAPNRASKWKMPFIAFSGWVWSYVIAAGIVFPLIYWAFMKTTKNMSTVSQTIMTLTALSFGNTAGPPPIPTPVRIIFFSWLIYVFHIDQAYQASLTGLITTAEYEPMMKTSEHLERSNLPTKAFAMYNFDKVYNVSRKDIRKLIKNYIPIERSLSEELKNMSSFKNFTIVENALFVKYTVSLMPDVSIYPTNVEYHETAYCASMLRHNYLYDRINWMLYRMYDAGFPVYFLRKTVPDKFWTSSLNYTARELSMRDLAGPFYILFIGLSIASLVFLYEVIYFEITKHHYRGNHETRVVRRNFTL